MPVYFVHGFRWPRAGFTGIRVHVIFENLENTSAEYIQTADSQAEILASFRNKWPEIMKELEGPGGKGLTLLEEHDPDDETSENAVSRPWAFVCDSVKTLPTGKVIADASSTRSGKMPETPRSPAPAENMRTSAEQTTYKGPALSLNITETIAQGTGSTARAWEALADLRDHIAKGEKIDWWVIYNGDPDRPYYDSEQDEDNDMTEQGEEVYEVQAPNRKTFVPQQDAIRRNPLPSRPLTAPGIATQAIRLPTREMPPPERPPAVPAKEKGKRPPHLKAFPPPTTGKPLPSPHTPSPQLPSPQVAAMRATPQTTPSTTPKSDSSMKRRFFGKK